MRQKEVLIKVQNKVHKMAKINFLWAQDGVKRSTETRKSIRFVVSILLNVGIASFITSTLLMGMKWCDLTKISCLMGIGEEDHKHPLTFAKLERALQGFYETFKHKGQREKCKLNRCIHYFCSRKSPNYLS